MKPKVILFDAVSLDGCTTSFAVDQGAFYALVQSFKEDATLAGCDTLLAATDANFDPPATPPTAAEPNDPRPILVVADSRGRLKGWPFWQSQPFWKNWISLCTDRTPADHIEALRDWGVTPLILGQDKVDLGVALARLAGDYRVGKVRVESGGRLNGALFEAGLADELHLLVHPTLLGGAAHARFAGDLVSAGGIPLRLDTVETRGEDLVFLGYTIANA
ncbi:RibD family protein [Bauldia sp.]|uniref:RibD family protein n=1 Tax=Bauldia sp. TaxID=2575872 RepID=UPI003BAB453D